MLFSKISSPPLLLLLLRSFSTALSEADSRLASFVASGRGDYLFLPSQSATYAVHGDFALGGAAPVNPSLLSLFERRLKPSNHVGLSIREATAFEASLRVLWEALSHSMWVLSALLAFVRLQNFAPEDSSLFNTLVTSLSKSLAHQDSLTATHTALLGLKRRQFYLSHLPSYFSDVNKQAMLSCLVVLASSLFADSDVSRLLADTQTSSSLRSQQALVEVASRGASARSLRSSPHRSPSCSSPSRRRRRESGSPSHPGKWVRFDSPAPSSALMGSKSVFEDRGHGLRPPSWGCLREHWEVWESWGTDPWVMEVLRFGYRIPFRVLPSLSQVAIPLPSYSPSSIRGIALNIAVADLRAKGAVEPAPSTPGYYSCLFVTPQGHRGWAAGDRSFAPQPFGPCLPLPHGDGPIGSPVSSSGKLDGVPGSPGRIPSGSGAPVILALPEVLRGSFSAAILHSLLRLLDCPSGVHACLCPCLLHHAPLRLQDLALPGRLAHPWVLVSGDSAAEGLSLLVVSGARRPCQPLQELPAPSQTLDYLGMRLQTRRLRVFPTPKRVRKLSSLLLDFVSCRQQPLPQWCQLLGVMYSLSAIVPGSRLRMRSLQLRFNVSGRLLPNSASVSWDDSCLGDLRWWSVESHLLVGLPLNLPQPDFALYTDASNSGWDAFLTDDHLSGSWPPTFLGFSINHRELLAVLYGVQGFLPVLRGRSVSLFADNTTALSYLRKQGGTHSATLNSVA